MGLATLALLLEPAAWLGAVVTVAGCLWALRRYPGNDQASLNWYLRNWRMRQVLGIAAVFYGALAVSCIILNDRWGWLYGLLAFKLGIWWYQRLVNEDITFPRLLRSRSRAALDS